MAVALIFWFLSPTLGIISVILSLYLADLSCLTAANYKSVLSSLYFIAVSTSAIANTEAFELAFRSSPLEKSDRYRATITIAYVFNILFFLVLVAIFSKTIKDSISDKFEIGQYDLFVVGVCIIISAIIGVIFKVELERAKEGL